MHFNANTVYQHNLNAAAGDILTISSASINLLYTNRQADILDAITHDSHPAQHNSIHTFLDPYKGLHHQPQSTTVLLSKNAFVPACELETRHGYVTDERS